MTDPETAPQTDFASGLARAQAFAMRVDHRLAAAILLRASSGTHATTMGDTSIWSLVRNNKASTLEGLAAVRRLCEEGLLQKETGHMPHMVTVASPKGVALAMQLKSGAKDERATAAFIMEAVCARPANVMKTSPALWDTAIQSLRECPERSLYLMARKSRVDLLELASVIAGMESAGFVSVNSGTETVRVTTKGWEWLASQPAAVTRERALG